jgi:hypothetical protein
MNIPIAPTMRLALRVYALPEFASPEVEVRYYSLDRVFFPGLGTENVLLRTERLRLRTYPATYDLVLLHPSFGSIANIETFPELAGEKAIWIEVSPVTPGLPIWAFVSITNNTTQQVTLVTPNGK